MPEPILISSIAGTVISAAILLTVGGTAAVAAWRWGEQSRNIIRVAFNKANEHEVQLFEKGILHDTPFRQLAGQYEALFASCCCGNPKYLKAAQRLRVALRRVVEEGLKLPPFGSPLLCDDESPRAAHTPIEERDNWEMLHLMRHPDFQRNEVIKRLRVDRGWRDYFRTLEASEGDLRGERPPEAGLTGPAGPPARRADDERHTERGGGSRLTSLDLGGFTAVGEGSVADGVPVSVFSGDGRASVLGSPAGGDRASGRSLHSEALGSPAPGSRRSRNPTGAPRGGDQPSAALTGSRRSMSGSASASATGGAFFSRSRPSPSTAGDSEGGLSRVTENNQPRGGPAALSQTDPAALEPLARDRRDAMATTNAWVAAPTEFFGVGPSVRSNSGIELAQQSSLYERRPSSERAYQGSSSGLQRPSPRGHSTRTSSEMESARRPRLPRIESASAEAAEMGLSGLGFVPARLTSMIPTSATGNGLADHTLAGLKSAGPSATDLPGWARFRKDQSLAGCSQSEVQPVLQEAVNLARVGSSPLPPIQPAPPQAGLPQAGPSHVTPTPEGQTSYVPSSNLAARARAEEPSTPTQGRMAAAGTQETPHTRNRNGPQGLIQHAATNAARQLEEQESSRRSASRAGVRGPEIPGRGHENSRRGSGASSGAVATRIQREEDAARARQQAGSPLLPVSPTASPSGSMAQSPERPAARPVVSTLQSPSRNYRAPSSQTMGRGK
ncbi:hypothetical protein EPUS_02348 [Endocarpon pusillum Z07020]|uniref:Uncharacterized protein n=1 Tax=Endocarpon pusillum (strain Z07020 / HMAS-L-300199) TaxID=1263415 RepID=U1GGC2_ENDPU|nr:uncharacterized protein EPUS_02348 [Endocarpon pusillum Z07020]ERF70826.1 hypothetical protein EPUS_02348 [Endocarpon pusillum Z07020]